MCGNMSGGVFFPISEINAMPRSRPKPPGSRLDPPANHDMVESVTSRPSVELLTKTPFGTGVSWNFGCQNWRVTFIAYDFVSSYCLRRSRYSDIDVQPVRVTTPISIAAVRDLMDMLFVLWLVDVANCIGKRY